MFRRFIVFSILFIIYVTNETYLEQLDRKFYISLWTYLTNSL